MAKRKTKSRRRRFRGVNLINAAEAVVGTNIVTENLFGTNALKFLIGWDSSGYGRSDLAVSGSADGIGELLGLNSSTTAEAAWSRTADRFMKNWATMAIQTVGTGIGFKLGKKLLAKQRRQINAGIRMIGLGDTVKV